MITKKQNPPYYETEVNTKIFRGLLTQSGTDAPTITVIKNELGVELTTTRIGAGQYTIDAPALIPTFGEGKTLIFTGSQPGQGQQINASRGGPVIISLTTWSGGILADGVLYQNALEIITNTQN